MPNVVRSGWTPKQRLRAAVAEPESGDYLIEDQQRPEFSGELPQTFQEPLNRRHHTHIRRDRFHDDRRNGVRVLLE